MSCEISNVSEGRREITLDELRDMKKGPNVNMNMVQVTGVVTIIDKDGKVKSKLDVVSLDSDEEI